MSRLNCKPKPIRVQRYSSLWFALKATQNGKDLRNGLIDDEVNQQLSYDNNETNEMMENNFNNDVMTNSRLNAINVIVIDSKRALVLINKVECNYELTFGCLRMTSMTDNYDIYLNGFTLMPNKSIELMAVFGYKISVKCGPNVMNDNQDINEVKRKLQSLELEPKQLELILSEMSENSSCIVLIEKLCLSSLLYLESVPNFKPLSMKSESQWFEFRNTGSFSFLSTNIWDTLFTQIRLTANDIIVVCGGKDVGKSSLIRYLVNRYLSENLTNSESNELLYLDCDPGQSELSTCGQISLTQIDKPILGSSPTNVINFKPLICNSIGFATANNNAKLYISNICNLINYISNNLQSKGPLFINTMGWTRDLGLALLIDIIKITRPTHVIQIDSKTHHRINFTEDLTPKSVMRCQGYRFGPSNRNESLDYKLTIIESQPINSTASQPKTNRMLTQLSYMSRMQNIIFKPIFAITPFKIYWSQVYVHIVSDSPIAPELVLDILNCSWVQLCQIDDREQISLNLIECDGTRIIGSLVENKCFGCGIIRGIDFQEKSFYLISPESFETISSINLIVRPSGISIPESIVLDQLKYSCSSNLPYIHDTKNHKLI